jgi:hypothetical protein
MQEELAGEPAPTEVELVFFDGCPRWRDALAHLEDALAQLGRSDSVTLQLLTNEAEAQQHHMAGSPTILIDGRDLFPDGAINPGRPHLSGKSRFRGRPKRPDLGRAAVIEVRPHAHCPPTTLW